MKKAIIIFVCCCFVAAFADNPHITKLVELVDVAISSPMDGQVLTFDAASGKWENKTAASQTVGSQIKSNIVMVGSGAPVAIWTPVAEGTYRVSVSLEDGGITSSAVLEWRSNDDINDVTIGNTAGTHVSESTVFMHVNAGQPITVMAPSSVTCYVVVEQLPTP